MDQEYPGAICGKALGIVLSTLNQLELNLTAFPVQHPGELAYIHYVLERVEAARLALGYLRVG